MSLNLDSPSPMQPLSVGNVVSAGLRLYRSHLMSYLQIACVAYLWVFVPVYGWAKCITNLALISRLAFGELVNQPEDVATGRRYVNSRLWEFLVMGSLMFLIGLFLVVILFIPFALFMGVFATSIAFGSNGNPNLLLLSSLVVIILVPILLIFILWIQARFLVVEVPLAIEGNIDGTSTIRRSWELTSGHVWRIVLILFVGYLITIPIQLPFSIINTLIQLTLQPLAKENFTYATLSFLISLVIGLLNALLVAPFWHSIKAVVYYDLRSRREGLGLRLRDRDI